MKKTLKKVLVVMAVVATVMLMMAFTASAADCGKEHRTVATYYAPTCTTVGYTRHDCTLCDYYSISADTEPPLGHDFAGVNYQYDYVEDGDYYKKGLTCQRPECGKTVYDSHLDENQESVYDRYYLVELINPWVAETFWEDITYTSVVKTYKEALVTAGKNATYGNWYIKEGDTLESYVLGLGYVDYTDWMNAVKSSNIVRRLKDKNYGAYDLAGWAYQKFDSGEYAESDIIVFNDTDNAVVTKNTRIYATFEGDETVTYEVQYRNADLSYMTTDFDVRHGEDADDSIFLPEYDADGNFVRYKNNILTKAEDIRYYYEYKGWNIDREHIYGDTTIVATYTPIAKEYDLEFYKWDNDEGKYVESGVYARAKYGYPLVYVDKDGNEFSKSEIEAIFNRDKDRTYIYSWTGNWEILGRATAVNSSSCSVPYDALDTRYEGEDGYAPTILIPTYNRRQNLYKTTVTIKFDQSVDFSGTGRDYETQTYLNGLNVQIMDANGQLMVTGTANYVESVDGAQFVCSLYDSQSYTVTVTSYRGKYSGTSTIPRTYVYDVNKPVYISVGLTVDEKYIEGQGCHCICHNSLFKPIWVRILNLLYQLFNVKYVCCDDMFVSLGDLIMYTK